MQFNIKIGPSISLQHGPSGVGQGDVFANYKAKHWSIHNWTISIGIISNDWQRLLLFKAHK
jgi:hypothetical protein